MQISHDLAQMNAQQLRDLATSLLTQVTQKEQDLKSKQLKIDQLTHEMAILKRWRFGRRTRRRTATSSSPPRPRAPIARPTRATSPRSARSPPNVSRARSPAASTKRRRCRLRERCRVGRGSGQ